MNTANVLFLCTGNSCRSQMAEGFANAMHSTVLRAYSAGTAPGAQVDPRAVQVMRECDIDIAAGTPKHVDALSDIAFDLVITVCDHANEHCPVFPGSTPRVIHCGFDDPPHLAQGAADEAADEAAALSHYRRVRDEIRTFITSLPTTLARNTSAT